jgi:lipopolysaccharide assembly protein A
MAWLRYGFLGVLLALAVTMALANRAPVTLSLWPEGVSAVLGLGLSVTLPLFVVVVGAVALGLLVGFVWEWLRERGIRVEAARTKRELQALKAREGATPEAAGPQDEILALVDGRKPG